MKSNRFTKFISIVTILAILGLGGVELYKQSKGGSLFKKKTKAPQEIEVQTEIEVPDDEVAIEDGIELGDDFQEAFIGQQESENSYERRARLLYNSLIAIGAVSDSGDNFSMSELEHVIRIINSEAEATGAHVANSNMSVVEDFYSSVNGTDEHIERANDIQTPSESRTPEFNTVPFGLSMYDMLVGDKSLGRNTILMEYLDNLHTLGLTCKDKEDSIRYCQQFFVTLRYLTNGVGINIKGEHYVMDDLIEGDNSVISMSLLELYIYDLAPFVRNPFTFIDARGVERTVDIDILLEDFRSGGKYYEAWSEAVNTQTSSMKKY